MDFSISPNGMHDKVQSANFPYLHIHYTLFPSKNQNKRRKVESIVDNKTWENWKSLLVNNDPNLEKEYQLFRSREKDEYEAIMLMRHKLISKDKRKLELGVLENAMKDEKVLRELLQNFLYEYFDDNYWRVCYIKIMSMNRTKLCERLNEDRHDALLEITSEFRPIMDVLMLV